MTSTAISQIEKLDAKLAQLIAKKKKITQARDGILLSALKENGAFDIEFSTLLGSLKSTVLKLKQNTFSENDLCEFKLLGEKYTKKNSRKDPTKTSKNPPEMIQEKQAA